MRNSGELILNHVDSKKILDAMRKLCKGFTEPITSLCQQLSNETDEYHEMGKYSELLKQSIGSILQKEEEKDGNCDIHISSPCGIPFCDGVDSTPYRQAQPQVSVVCAKGSVEGFESGGWRGIT